MEEVPVCIGPSALNLRIASPLGVGLWSWGDKWTWGHRGYDAALTESSMSAAFLESMKSGVNFFDTAEVYGASLLGGWGQSERYLGGCLAAAGDTGRGAVVVSKYMPLPWRLREPSSMLAALDASVQRLGVQQLGVYLVHNPVTSLRSTQTLARGLAAAVDSGMTRAVGVSNYSEEELRETHRVLAEAGVPLALNQVELSLCHSYPLHSGLLDACQELGVSLVAYSPLAMGRLTGKYSTACKPQGARRFGNYPFEKIQPIVDRLQTLGEAHGGKTPAQVALNWVICKGAIPIPGAKSAKQASGNAGALGWRLTTGEVEELDALAITGSLKLGQHG